MEVPATRRVRRQLRRPRLRTAKSLALLSNHAPVSCRAPSSGPPTLMTSRMVTRTIVFLVRYSFDSSFKRQNSVISMPSPTLPGTLLVHGSIYDETPTTYGFSLTPKFLADAYASLCSGSTVVSNPVDISFVKATLWGPTLSEIDSLFGDITLTVRSDANGSASISGIAASEQRATCSLVFPTMEWIPSTRQDPVVRCVWGNIRRDWINDVLIGQHLELGMFQITISVRARDDIPDTIALFPVPVVSP